MFWIDKRDDCGPFDIIGDVHGCAAELQALLTKLSYDITWHGNEERTVTVTPPPGRKVIFVGDLVDRGPNTPDVLRIVMSMTAAGTAYAVSGNHEEKLARWLMGDSVKIGRGIRRTINQLMAEPAKFGNVLIAFLNELASYIWLDGGRLAVAHAGLTEEMLGQSSSCVHAFALHGCTTGQIDAYGLPIRANWMANHHGTTMIVYGHTPVTTPARINNTTCIDTGCVYGGKLTALRWPEDILVDVPAEQNWVAPIGPIGPLPCPIP